MTIKCCKLFYDLPKFHFKHHEMEACTEIGLGWYNLIIFWRI